MMNVSSLSQTGHMLFSLDTQSGIADVLAAIRVSDIASDQKNELRDLVFLYTNGGKDETVRRSLEQKIAAYNLKPAPKKAPAHKPLPPPPKIGSFRAAPSFSVPQATAAPKKEVSFTDAPVWKPVPVATPQPVVEDVPPPVQAPVSPPVVEQPQPVVQAAPQSIPIISSTVPTGDQQQYLDRIREIKAAVNEKVGNPVNLVDIDNEVGREYMGALLDAMKKLNTGASPVAAMERLEASFAMVETVLKNQTVSAPVPSPAAPTPVPQIPTSIPVSQVPVPPPVSAPQPAYSAPQPVVPVPPPVTPLPEPMIPAAAPFSPPAMPTQMPTAPVAAPVPPQFASMQAEVPRAPIVSQFSSLADLTEKPHTPYDLPISNTPQTANGGDQLFSAEVDDGLDQLLAEWAIFKKSGLFGTGPKGKEHPLFKKMAPLQIPLLLAGRFDGATQEIKQSITDYMNGWRYEQGLIYEKGETFEHYLRRVIRHILDLQKK